MHRRAYHDRRGVWVPDRRSPGLLVRDDEDYFRFYFQTANRRPPSRGMICPRVAWIFALGNGERAQGRPGARCTRGLVCKMVRETHTSIQVQRRQSGLPCAMVLRLTSSSPW
jgi:hypothetical protein